MLRIRFIIIVIIIIIIIIIITITIIIMIRKKYIPINNSCGGVRCVECSVNRQTSFFSLIFLLQQGDPNSDILSSSSQESSLGVETSREWQPPPLVKYQLRYLNSYLMKSTDGRMSPVRSQCKSDVMTISSSSQRYYREKASQAVDTVLNAIAPRNSSWLLQKTFEKYHSGQAVPVTSEEDILVNRLVTLYNEANSWYTQQ